MNEAMFERLLYEEESTTLDFKREQYRFAKASEEEKSELLKDVLGFANAWRRSEAIILIGVQDVRGGRGEVIGISVDEHLDDHSLQQFVNNLTNRPVRFHYEAFGYEGKQVGVIRIEEQQRPIYLRRDFGKLKKSEVYVRRGSSTDPTKPASIDEIAQMGREQTVESAIPSFAVEFAALDRDQPIGSQIEWAAELCKTPENESIPKLDDRPSTFRLPGGGVFQMPNLSITSFHDRLNEDYYADFASYLFVHRLFRQVRLVVTNTGEASANEVRLEIHVPNGLGVGIVYDSEIPKKPKKRENYLAMSRFNELDIRPVRHRSGCVEIEKNSHETKLEIECGLLQPGRRVWTDAFWIGIGQSGEVRLAGRLYAANLPQPREFTLSINATVGRTTLSVEDLIALGDQDFEMDEEQPEES